MQTRINKFYRIFSKFGIEQQSFASSDNIMMNTDEKDTNKRMTKQRKNMQKAVI